METTKSRINELSGNIREYIETRIDILKLDAADTTASAASTMVSWVAVLIVALLVLLLITLGGAIAIGTLIQNMAGGFFIMAGAYCLIILIIYFNRENWIRKPVLNAIIKNIYDND
ncbi:MAG TPA: phage holin family protein [Bacteroidia bacterium]|nr:phage holin family protein [Bacteroidia bacterium]